MQPTESLTTLAPPESVFYPGQNIYDNRFLCNQQADAIDSKEDNGRYDQFQESVDAQGFYKPCSRAGKQAYNKVIKRPDILPDRYQQVPGIIDLDEQNQEFCDGRCERGAGRAIPGDKHKVQQEIRNRADDNGIQHEFFLFQ